MGVCTIAHFIVPNVLFNCTKRYLNQEEPNIVYSVCLRVLNEPGMPRKKQKMTLIPLSSDFKKDVKKKVEEIQQRVIVKEANLADDFFRPVVSMKLSRQGKHFNPTAKQRKMQDKRKKVKQLSKDKLEINPVENVTGVFVRKKRSHSPDDDSLQRKNEKTKQYLSQNKAFENRLSNLSNDTPDTPLVHFVKHKSESSELSAHSPEKFVKPENLVKPTEKPVKQRPKGRMQFNLLQGERSFMDVLGKDNEAIEEKKHVLQSLPKCNLQDSDQEVNVFLENFEQQFILELKFGESDCES